MRDGNRRMRLIATRIIGVVVLAVWAGSLSSDTRPVAGMRENTPRVHALTNARIVPEPGKEIARGTIVIRDGRIEAVGANEKVPADARVWDLDGLTVYAGLIEPYAQIGLPKDGFKKGSASHWNPLVHPEFRVQETYRPTEDELKGLRALGFTAALAVPKAGAFRGQSVLVGLGKTDISSALIRGSVAQHLAFERKSWRDQVYPGSLMGSIALMRQMFVDANWYREASQFAAKSKSPRPEHNISFEQLASAAQGLKPVVFESNNVLNHLRAIKIAKEFGLQAWIRGQGDEYRELPRLIGSGATLLLPLDFPDKPPVASLDDELNVSLARLQHWESAPTNPRQLHEADVPFVLTSSVLKVRNKFPDRLREAIAEGLPEDVALAALTTRTARLLGVERELGSIEKGKRAHLVVSKGKLFDKGRKIRQVWVDGDPFDVEVKAKVDPEGSWDVVLDPNTDSRMELILELSGDPASLKGTFTRDSTKVSLNDLTLDLSRLSATFKGDSLGMPGVFRAVVDVSDERLEGRVIDSAGVQTALLASRRPAKDEASPKEEVIREKTDPVSIYPLGAFGLEKIPDQPKIVFVKNATVWTSGPQGRFQGDLLVESGRIVAVGADWVAPDNALVIDATGKHVTPGLIDCHSHQAMQGGLNEGTEAVTCEVRAEDVVTAWDEDIYRELAGGLTTAHLLHGSSNPIGGQSVVIKLRWGHPANELIMQGAKPGVKFALGENVKRSNWTTPTSRYPKTRMGVEQIMRDRFKGAQEYRSEWQRWEGNKGKLPKPRRDLENEALVEIVEGKRAVHSHSYRQDEILMLIRVADDFGFTIGTFQHVLEGYKVAEALLAHGAAASTFSDWWSYKVEAFDAIPFNGALMHQVGVNVSFNSDSGELARRMNLEAAKAVKDGGVSEEEALKFVTLNPAIQLGIDDRVGSLEAGKDADFVIWSGDPLSTYSICEQTWVDGRRYFSLEEDGRLRERDLAERNRLIQKVLGRGGARGQGAEGKD
jgi:imidazolonepropionase-like amidohydrolase